MSPKHVDGTRARNDAAANLRSATNHALLSWPNPKLLSVRVYRVAALDHHEILIELMDVLRGFRVQVALPERHLSSIRPVEDVALHARGMLRRARDPIGRAFHELRKFSHAALPLRLPGSSALSANELEFPERRLRPHHHRCPTAVTPTLG